MILLRRRWVPAGLVVAVGGSLGLAAATYPLEAVALMVVGSIALSMVLYPRIGIPFVFISIALSNAAGTLFTVGMPITLSKLSVMGALACWGLHTVLFGKRVLKLNKLTWVMLLPVASTLLSMAQGGGLNSVGINYLLSCLMLIVMVHYFDTVLQPTMLPEIGWYLAAGFVVIIAVGALTAEPVMDIHAERSTGVFDNANLWAALMLCTAPVIIALIRKHTHWTAEVLIWAIVILVPINLFLTMSRTGLASYLVAFPVLVVLLWDRRYKLLIALAAVLILAPVFADPAALFTRYSTLIEGRSEFDSSMQLRQDSVAYGLKLFYNNPLMGVGAGTFERESILSSSGLAQSDPHNHYVRILAEEGLVGAVANIIFVGSIAWALIYRLQRRFTTQTRFVALGMLGSLFSLAMFGFGADMMTFAPAWAILGVGFVLFRDPGTSASTPTAEPLRDAEC
ncbi:MAG: O-antigen ligase family protein [Myxococcota bacterium]